MNVIPIHYNPAIAVSNWLAIEAEALEIAKFIDGKDYGPHKGGIFALHAAQVNPKPFNYFVLNPEPLGKVIDELGSRFIVNARIDKFPPELLQDVKEGCVSFPNRKQRYVKRSPVVNVVYEIPDIKSKTGLKQVKKQVKHILAQIFQHECDHAQGKNIHFNSK